MSSYLNHHCVSNSTGLATFVQASKRASFFSFIGTRSKRIKQFRDTHSFLHRQFVCIKRNIHLFSRSFCILSFFTSTSNCPQPTSVNCFETCGLFPSYLKFRGTKVLQNNFSMRETYGGILPEKR